MVYTNIRTDTNVLVDSSFIRYTRYVAILHSMRARSLRRQTRTHEEDHVGHIGRARMLGARAVVPTAFHSSTPTAARSRTTLNEALSRCRTCSQLCQTAP